MRFYARLLAVTGVISHVIHRHSADLAGKALLLKEPWLDAECDCGFMLRQSIGERDFMELTGKLDGENSFISPRVQRPERSWRRAFPLLPHLRPISRLQGTCLRVRLRSPSIGGKGRTPSISM